MNAGEPLPPAKLRRTLHAAARSPRVRTGSALRSRAAGAAAGARGGRARTLLVCALVCPLQHRHPARVFRVQCRPARRECQDARRVPAHRSDHQWRLPEVEAPRIHARALPSPPARHARPAKHRGGRRRLQRPDPPDPPPYPCPYPCPYCILPRHAAGSDATSAGPQGPGSIPHPTVLLLPADRRAQPSPLFLL